jgi:DNA-directed RNA polymerase subunit RPC12/RpoP
VRKTHVAAVLLVVGVVALSISLCAIRTGPEVQRTEQSWLCIECGKTFTAPLPPAASDLDVMEGRVRAECPQCGKPSGRLYSVLKCRNCGREWNFPHLLEGDPESANAPLACPRCGSPQYETKRMAKPSAR